MHTPHSAQNHALQPYPSFVLPTTSSTAVPNEEVVSYAEGQTIAHIMGLGRRAFVVNSGEIAIYVNGRPVDLVEAGEYFDESIWLGGEAVALTDCTLRIIEELQPSFF